MHGTEIKRGVFHGNQSSRRDLCVIKLRDLVRIDKKFMGEYLPAARAVQIKIAVVCHIDQRVGIRFGFIENGKFIILRPAVGDSQSQVSGISFIAVRGVQRQHKPVIPDL